MSILTVGAGQQFSTLAKAVAAAQDGDVIAVQAGTYTNDFTTITKDLTIEGVGGVAKFVATAAPTNGKAIMVTRADITVRNLEFTGAEVADDNGAGIRYEGGHLTVENSYFHHNQNGLLSNGDADGSITVRNSEFAFNGAGDGQSHNLYVNRVASLTVDNSYFHDVNNGHHIKSRALTTTVTDSRVIDGAGTSSYNIDLPNGGDAVIENNVIQQSNKSPNHTLVSYGAEGSIIAGSSLRMANNLVIDDHMSTYATMLVNRTTVVAQVGGTDVWGLSSSRIASGPADVSGTSFLASRPTLDTSSTWDDDSAAATPPTTTDPAPSTGTTITGTSSSETLTGGSGNDVLKGLGGNDVLKGAAGADTMYGGTGSDKYYVDNSGDVIVENTKEGIDTVYSTVDYTLRSYVENLTLTGTASNDATGNSYHNVLTGNGGANVLTGLGGNDTLVGGAGTDTAVYAGARSRYTLAVDSSGAIVVTDGTGSEGKDRLTSIEKLQFSDGVVDASTIGSSSTSDPAPSTGTTITGTSSSETLTGGSGNDVLKGLGGNDTLKGAAGADTMYGGTGSDKFYVDNSGDVITEYTKEGVDTVYSSVDYTLRSYVENLTLTGTASLDATGNSWHNKLYGNSGSNELTGGGGNDRLYGKAGNDTLVGGDGNDFFQGGTGTDTLSGGAGADKFDWNSTADVGKGTARDVILDMVRGSDKIDLSGIDANSATSTNDAFRFIGNDTFNGVKGELRFYDGGTFAIVQGDVNGDRAVDMEIKVQGTDYLTSTDFVL